MDAVNGFNDSMNKREQAEIDKHNRMECDRVRKDLAEQERFVKQKDFVNSMLDRWRNREDAEIRQRQAEKREREMREQSRRTAENLRRYDDLVAKNE